MPVSYAAIYIEIAADRGVSQAQILQQAKLPNHLLANAMGRISPRQYVQFVTAVIQLTGDNGLGFEVGARQPLTAHGSLGYALLCCSTVKEAVDVLQRFWNIRPQSNVRRICHKRRVTVVNKQDDTFSCLLRLELTALQSPRIFRGAFRRVNFPLPQIVE